MSSTGRPKISLHQVFALALSPDLRWWSSPLSGSSHPLRCLRCQGLKSSVCPHVHLDFMVRDLSNWSIYRYGLLIMFIPSTHHSPLAFSRLSRTLSSALFTLSLPFPVIMRAHCTLLVPSPSHSVYPAEGFASPGRYHAAFTQVHCLLLFFHLLLTARLSLASCPPSRPPFSPSRCPFRSSHVLLRSACPVSLMLCLSRPPLNPPFSRPTPSRSALSHTVLGPLATPWSSCLALVLSAPYILPSQCSRPSSLLTPFSQSFLLTLHARQECSFQSSALE